MARGRKPSVEGRRDEIMRIATEVFIDHGYSGTTMLEIATRANASKTTLYALFRDKAALFEALLLARLARISEGLEPDAALDQADQHAFLRLSAERILTAVTEPATIGLYRVAIAELARCPELTPILVKSRDHTGLTAYLAACRDRGLMAFADAEAASDMFVSMATGEWVHLMLIGALKAMPPAAVAAHAELTARLYLRAVSPGEVPGKAKDALK